MLHRDVVENLHQTGVVGDKEEDNILSGLVLNRLYFLALIGSVLLTGLFIAMFLNFSRYPFDDAAMLLRYALHLAQGSGIVWNVGDKPVDGGTDFLYMVFLAGLVKAGLTVEISARLVGIGSHLLTAIIIYFAIVRLHNGSRWLALLSATYLAIGPGLEYISAYFGTTFFALFACVTWYLANRLVKEANSNVTPILFALSGLIMGLIRPEGVLLAILMLLAVLYMKGKNNSQKVILYFLAIFLFLGGAYFLWRWNYFGYPLPNPFYKKGGGHLYFSSLGESLRAVFHLLGPFTIAFVLGFRSAKTSKQTIFLLIPTAGFTLIWILLSNEMNYLGRFQYAVLPLVLMSWPALVKDIWKDFKLPQLRVLDRRGQFILIVIIGCMFLGTLGYQYLTYTRDVSFRDGRYDVGTMLNSYSYKNYTMVTTESGILPLYSNWRDVDAWGLNDQWIAHHGLITSSYLDTYKPEVIMIHAYFSPLTLLKDDTNNRGELDSWSLMVLTLKDYAESHGYILAAAFGVSPYDTHYYYVRADFPDSGDIVKQIESISYYWYDTGQKCINYAKIPPTQ